MYICTKQKRVKMAKDPAVLFYTSDFLSGTFTMDYEQKGKYITLLCIQHQKGFLTEKDLKSILSDTDVDVFSKFNLDEDGFYYNSKMRECAEKRKKYSESRSNNRKSKKDMNNISSTYDNHMNNISKSYVKHMENENENENVIKNINVIENENVIDFQYTTGLIEKILDRILQYENTKLHREALEDLKDCGGIDRISEFLNWDESVKQNWLRAINQSIQIHNDK